MQDLPAELEHLIQVLKQFEGVQGIMLGGSRAQTKDPRQQAGFDASSDYDLYLYFDQLPPTQERARAYSGLFSYLELNNRFWECEDDGRLSPSGIPVDIIWRAPDWVEQNIRDRSQGLSADVGYTTCIWYNVANAQLLFDRSGVMKKLKELATAPYPDTLVQAIIAKNHPLLRDSIASFCDQILKAADRGDVVSVQHRSAAFLASWFDLLFAANRTLHPGEKRLEQKLSQLPLQPKDWQPCLHRFLDARTKPELASSLDQLCELTDTFLKEQGLLKASLRAAAI